jgi:hypothetical protein
VFKRQSFNWLLVSPDWELEGLRKVQVESRVDCGLLWNWNFVMLGQMTTLVNPTRDDAQLRESEVEVMAREILRVWEVSATATEENLTKTVGSVV